MFILINSGKLLLTAHHTLTNFYCSLSDSHEGPLLLLVLLLCYYPLFLLLTAHSTNPTLPRVVSVCCLCIPTDMRATRNQLKIHTKTTSDFNLLALNFQSSSSLALCRIHPKIYGSLLSLYIVHCVAQLCCAIFNTLCLSVMSSTHFNTTL